MWTCEIEACLAGDEPTRRLEEYKLKLDEQLREIANMLRSDSVSSLYRKMASALVTIDVHQRDVTVQMAESHVVSSFNFEWLAQLRYYWRQEGEGAECETMEVHMMHAHLPYDMEYLGNATRLVISPHTDRGCSVTGVSPTQGRRRSSPPGRPALALSGTARSSSAPLAFVRKLSKSE